MERPEGERSTVMELKRGSDHVSAEIVWEYPPVDSEETIYSKSLSGAQRLPNGNTLICAGVSGTLLEVTAQNQIVWKYINPVQTQAPSPPGHAKHRPRHTRSVNMIYRAYKYPPDYTGLRFFY